MHQGYIGVCTNGADVLEDRLRLAPAVAERLDWSIQVLTFRQPPPAPDTAPDLLGSGTESEVSRQRWDDEEEAARAARRTYDSLVSPGGQTGRSGPTRPTVAVEWIEVLQPLESSLPSHARAFDMIVAGGRSDDPSASTLNDGVSSVCLHESGRLVLLAVHPTVEDPGPFARVLIAWDDGPTVTRTIAQALPLIAAADSVRLLVVETDARRVTPVNSMLAYLRRHAPSTTVHAVSSPLRPVGRTILEEAQAFEASLIVMGAYEHSRNREIIFGGTTRTVVDHARCPVLMTR